MVLERIEQLLEQVWLTEEFLEQLLEWAAMDMGLRIITVGQKDLSKHETFSKFVEAVPEPHAEIKNLVKFEQYSSEELKTIAFSVIPKPIMSKTLQATVIKVVGAVSIIRSNSAAKMLLLLGSYLEKRKERLQEMQKQATEKGNFNLTSAAAAGTKIEWEISPLDTEIQVSAAQAPSKRLCGGGENAPVVSPAWWSNMKPQPQPIMPLKPAIVLEDSQQPRRREY